ncbi:MAG: Holliday junction resolvase RuvX [Candidatus Margulisiibacteriota bacterium]|jgi:putative Holliday junction resolvase
MRLLAIDFGLARIGLAVSDLLMITAQPIKQLQNDAGFFDKFQEIITQYKVTKIILGNPKKMNGSAGTLEPQIAKFKAELENRTNLEVVMWDERLTTRAVLGYLNKSELKSNKKKEILDSLSASYILQGYMDYLGK